jgi:alpha-mannosidase
MSLSTEWRHRLDVWRKELPNHLYRELGVITLEGFTTKEQLPADQAARGPFRPMPEGASWGAKWEYGWFRGEVTLPQAALGQRIALKVDVGAESLIYINGQAAGAKDMQHHEITLAMSGIPGTTYQILLEGYAGHGPRVTSGGPCPPDRQTVPEPSPTQVTVGHSSYGIWEEQVYQLLMDVETLYHVREQIEQDSLRVAEIDRALRDFTILVDYELPHYEMLKTVEQCRARLKPLLECVNGSTAPLLFAFGHAHIDVAWLWPLAETERKTARTFSTQLALAQEYPEYKFLQSEPHLYWMIQQRYPDIYQRVKDAVMDGRVIADGGMWVEADTNISSGESLIRQFVHGKRFFRKEFGVENELLWLPDVFGYSGAMPQIMRDCGCKYFSTAKIFWAYNGGDPFPYNTFTWEGIDGSEVLVHLCNDYNSRTDPASVIQRWNQRVQKEDISTRLFPFGYGDGGGGPTRDHLEYLRRQRNLEGAPQVRMATPMDYFRDLETRGVPAARYVGELYFQAHRGTYTSQAKTKRGNRKSELALREAEMWGAFASSLAGWQYPAERMESAWRAVLLNQFHDIIPGSSIHRVYEEAEDAYQEVIAAAQDVATQAASKLTDQSRALTAFNSLSWQRKALVALPDGFGAETLPVQSVGAKTWAEVDIPSCGWTTVRPGNAVAPKNTLVATANLLENAQLRIKLNSRGEIISIYDKEIGRELAAGLCNCLCMYKDVPSHWDAWDLDSMYTLTPVELNEPAVIEVAAAGPLFATLKVTRKLHQSALTQEITLRRDSRRVDFATKIDWQETHKMLKVNFPVNIHANEAIHEIQFGHIRRPNHQSRPFDADRFEVSNHKWTALTEENRGCAVLNDCKYGVNVLDNSMNLTLLKSALAPDMTADKGLQEFTYAFYAWNGSLAESGIVHEAYDLNCPVSVVSGAAGEKSILTMDAPNVVIETVKPAEDGSGEVVVRLYETMRMSTRCTLSTSLPVQSAAETDMLENGKEALICDEGKIVLELRPFEIKTVRLKCS